MALLMGGFGVREAAKELREYECLLGFSSRLVDVKIIIFELFILYGIM